MNNTDILIQKTIEAFKSKIENHIASMNVDEGDKAWHKLVLDTLSIAMMECKSEEVEGTKIIESVNGVLEELKDSYFTKVLFIQRKNFKK